MLDGLHEIENLPGVTVSEARAISVTRGHYEQIVKAKLEIMVPDAMVDVVVSKIKECAHTGNVGDGGVFVIPVERGESIRTGQALT